MKRIQRCSSLAFLLFAAVSAGSEPAARVGDPGQPALHAGSAITTGSPTVLIGGQPAARQGDATTCPQLCVIQTLPPTVVPHSDGVILNGSATVLINGRPAAKVGSAILEGATPAN